jgi:hypothetical protein
MFKLRIVVPALLFALAAGLPAPAQTSPRPGQVVRVPVALVLVDSLAQPGVPYVVQRRPNALPHDVILLRPDATAAQLSEAINSLLMVREARGDFPTAAGTLRVHPHGNAAAARQRRPFPWAQRVFHDLHHAKAAPVAGVGKVQSVVIYLPPHRGRR